MESLELVPTRVRITTILKKAIFNGEYRSGDELSLTDIAAKLGVSRTPVREAFQALEADGLIELRMNKGALVKPIDEKFIRNHYELRMLLEGEAAYKAAQKQPDVSDLLTRLYHLKDNLNNVSEQDYIDLNFDIHSFIWEQADNPRLFQMILSLWNGPSVGKNRSAQNHYQSSTEEHIHLLLQIRKGNSDRAREAMQSHLRRSMENIINAEKSYPTVSQK